MAKQGASDISPVMKTLATYISQAGSKSMPKEVVERTKHHLLDTQDLDVLHESRAVVGLDGNEVVLFLVQSLRPDRRFLDAGLVRPGVNMWQRYATIDMPLHITVQP